MKSAEWRKREFERLKALDEQARLEAIRAQVRAKYENTGTTITINGVIGNGPGEISAQFVKSQLPTDGAPIEVKFHSEGGAVFEALAMFDVFASYPGKKTAVVESMAFSAASLLLCAFDTVEAAPMSYVMIHAPHMELDEVSDSDSRLLAQLRERMIGIYSERTGKPRAFIEREIDREVFYDAEAAIDLGIVDRISSRPSLVTARLPQRVMAKIKAAQPPKETAKARWQAAVNSVAATGKSVAQAIQAVEKSHPGLRSQMIREANK